MKSSTFSRIVSGSLASWCRIGITIIAQIVVTPIFLSHWSADIYGIWLVFIAITGFLQILDTGHQTYLNNKFLILGKDNKAEIIQTLSSSLLIAAILALLELVFTIVLVNTSLLYLLFNDSQLDVSVLRILLITHVLVWGVTGSLGGILTRVLSPFGYFSRFAWWGTAMQAIMTIMPVFVVLAGGELLSAGLTMTAGVLLVNCGMLLDVKRIFRIEDLTIGKPSWHIGYKNFRHSILLILNNIFEMFRQQGVRLMLSPLSGALEMAAFVTMRTGTNVALQGLNTLTNPLLPELMRFLNQRDQARSEAAFSTVWIVVIVFMAPAVVILQAFIQPLYTIWTRGKIPFDPALFAILSLSVLVYAAIQPAIAVVTGNNLLVSRLTISVSSAIFAVGGMAILVPNLGIRGAGISLLGAEIISFIGYRYVAQSWLKANGLYWPVHQFRIAVISVGISAVAMFMVIARPDLRHYIVPIAILLLVGSLWWYWQVLPELATQRVVRMVTSLPGLKILFSSKVVQ